ncbi:MAG TPA: TSUP family transporter [Acidimicrobiia bacterium]|nr:TSUP family transporter [Acidimicrobiia bacterium]
MSDVFLLVGLAAATSGIGALGGLGGAVILVPALVLAGWSPMDAAPLGLISVAAGSVAAGARQLSERSVNHRIGVTTELAATAGAVVGALVADRFSDEFLVYLLASVALAAAFMGGRRKGLRNPPIPGLGMEDVGERVGSLSGAYPAHGGVASYETRRLPLGLAFMSVAGLVAGTTGASGGFIKTPATSEIMHVPTKVAASTTTFTIGITASAALIVFALRGRLDIQQSSAVVFGSLAGGAIGAIVQSRLHPVHVRRALSVVLVLIAILLVITR